MTVGTIAPASLEDWLRHRYFTVPLDISSSGVDSYSLGELRELLGIAGGELDAVVFRDSPTVGSAPLRAAIAARFAPGRAADVMVTHGSSEAIFLALAAVVRPGDEVVVMRPAYQSLVSIAEALGARLRVWSLPPEQDFAPDLERLAALLTRRTRAVVVNFPHNPTGVTLSEQAYARLLALVARHGCVLLWDGAFSELVYDRKPLPDPGAVIERCVSVGTLSKAYGLPGLRIGWAIAGADVLADMIRIRDYLTLATSPLAERLAEAVLGNAEAVLRPALNRARANRQLLVDWVADHADLVSCVAPAGGVTAFPRSRRLADVTPLCAELAERAGVLVVPGSCFGCPDRIRIGFGGAAETLAEGLERVAAALVRAAPPRKGAAP